MTVALVLGITACSSPKEPDEGEGDLTLVFAAPGQHTISMSAPVGQYTLTVTAWLYGVVYAEGSSAAPFNVEAGKKVTVPIQMHPIFTNIAAFKEWLDKQPPNTKAAPYNVKLNLDSLGGDYNTAGSLGNALKANATKYVILDLSGSTMTTIPEWAFCVLISTDYGCTTLIGITIPDSVTTILAYAFGDCTSLTSVTIGNSVTTIWGYAFNGCTSLTSVTFQGTIPFIGVSSDAFYNLGDLRTKFYETNTTNGTPGTYTRDAGGTAWTKQP